MGMSVMTLMVNPPLCVMWERFVDTTSSALETALAMRVCVAVTEIGKGIAVKNAPATGREKTAMFAVEVG